MATDSIGTQLYYYSTKSSSVKEVGCIFDITDIGVEWETSDAGVCLATGNKLEAKGGKTIKEVTIELPQDYKGDTAKELWELADAGTRVNFLVGYADGTATPTSFAPLTGVWTLPKERTFVAFGDSLITSHTEGASSGQLLQGSITFKPKTITKKFWESAE